MPELHPYQVRGVQWIRRMAAQHRAALLADDMGVGKTPQALCAPPADAPVIVVAPGCLREQTAERILQWRGTGTRVRIADGWGSFAAPGGAEWLVCNPELLPAAPAEVKRTQRDADEDDGTLALDAGRTLAAGKAAKKLERLGKQGTFDPQSIAPGTWLIVDECHEYATHTTQQTERLRAIGRVVRKRGGVCLGVTATPLLNDPGELRGNLVTLGLGGVAWPSAKGSGLDLWGFLRDWGGAPGVHGGHDWGGTIRVDRVVDALRRVMLRRRFRDAVPGVPDLEPPQRIRVALEDADLAQHAADLEERLRDRARKLQTSKQRDRVLFEEVAEVRAAMAVAKLPAAHAWCDAQEAAGEQWGAVCVSRDVVRALGKRPGAAMIDGGVPPEKRAEIVRRYQRGELRGVALTIRAGGVGIDLFRGARVLAVSREWNPALNRQALARWYRLGQTRPVALTLLLADHPLEDRLGDLLTERREYLRVVDAASVPADPMPSECDTMDGRIA